MSVATLTRAMSNSTNSTRTIASELYRSLVLLGAESDLLGIVGSWGDTLPDADVLQQLQAWNHSMAMSVKGRIEHYETSVPHPACSQILGRETYQATP